MYDIVDRKRFETKEGKAKRKGVSNGGSKR
jgi:hypothetical protein